MARRLNSIKIPQLAAHLDCCEATVRSLWHRFADRGLAAVHLQPSGFLPDLARRRRIEAAPDRLPGQPRVWTVTTLSEALAAEAEIHLQPRTVRRCLKRMGATWRRTYASVRHRQDPPRRGTQTKCRDGQPDLFFLDQTGLAPPCRPPAPGPVRACDRSFPTGTRRVDA